MSARKWKRLREGPKLMAERLDKRERRLIRPPLRVRVLAWFVPATRDRWQNKWERAHALALRKTVKHMSHVMEVRK